MSAYIYYSNELYHHGILGQKWGVRRFQNADGTRTAAGKKRRKYEVDDLSDLSDEEIQKKTERMNKEINYHNKKWELYRATRDRRFEEGAKAVQDASKVIGAAIAITAGVVTLKKNGKVIVDAVLDSIGSGTIPAAAMTNAVTRKMF